MAHCRQTRFPHSLCSGYGHRPSRTACTVHGKQCMPLYCWFRVVREILTAAFTSCILLSRWMLSFAKKWPRIKAVSVGYLLFVAGRRMREWRFMYNVCVCRMHKHWAMRKSDAIFFMTNSGQYWLLACLRRWLQIYLWLRKQTFVVYKMLWCWSNIRRFLYVCNEKNSYSLFIFFFFFISNRWLCSMRFKISINPNYPSIE